MSSDDDKCFQCQETGHMACYCPHIGCFDCNNYGHVAGIALTKSHLQACQQDAGTTTLIGVTDQHLGVITTPHITTVTIGIGTDSVNLNPTHITLDIGDHLPVHNQHPGSPRIGSTNRLQLMTHPQNIISLMNRTVIQRIL